MNVEKGSNEKQKNAITRQEKGTEEKTVEGY